MRGMRPFNFSAFMSYNAAAEVMVMAAIRRPTLIINDQELEEAIRLSEAYARIFPIGRPRSLLWRGMLRGRKRRTQSAVAQIREATEAARSLDMVLDVARALYELAHLGSDDREEAEAITYACHARGVAMTHGAVSL